MKKINIWAVIVSAIAGVVLGTVWYGVFGGAWAEGVRVTEEMLAAGLNPLTYLLNLLAAVAYSLAIALLLAHLQKEGVKEALRYGLLVALLIIMPGVISNGAFLSFSAAAITIDVSFLVLRAVVVSLIIGAWKPKTA